MNVDLYTSAGKKKGSVDLPAVLFEAPVNEGLMHEALRRQQSNRRTPLAHAKRRSDIVGSTRKLIRQKGTGNARKGSASANVLRGGAKSFGPSNVRNFTKQMPRNQRRAALRSCLSYSAQQGRVIGLEGYDGDAKTKSFVELMAKLPVNSGRKTVFVLPEHHENLERAAANIPGVKTLLATYLNPEDVLGAHHLVFLVDALKVAEETFAKHSARPTGSSGRANSIQHSALNAESRKLNATQGKESSSSTS